MNAASHRDTCMALTPDAIHLSPSLSDPAADAALAEGLAALESCKKKDPTKGSDSYIHVHSFVAKLSLNRMSNRHSFFFFLPSVVVVRFKAVGNAPIMKQNFFRVTVSNHFQAVIQFLRRELGWKAGDPLVSEQSRALLAPICVGCSSVRL